MTSAGVVCHDRKLNYHTQPDTGHICFSSRDVCGADASECHFAESLVGRLMGHLAKVLVGCLVRHLAKGLVGRLVTRLAEVWYMYM